MDFSGIFLIIVISVVVFLIAREVVCWYWKINENVALLREIRDLLKYSQADNSGVNAELEKNTANQATDDILGIGK